MRLVQGLAELKLLGGDGGCIGSAERRVTTSKAMARWTGEGAEGRAKLESTLSRERPACCHDSNRESTTVIED